jgi:hypothetical protein
MAIFVARRSGGSDQATAEWGSAVLVSCSVTCDPHFSNGARTCFILSLAFLAATYSCGAGVFLIDWPRRRDGQ